MNIFELDMIFIPVHIRAIPHWCLLCVDFVNKRFDYYDSIGGGKNTACLKVCICVVLSLSLFRVLASHPHPSMSIVGA
jgi:hypothetical protein